MNHIEEDALIDGSEHDQYFRRLLNSSNRTISKVRRIDIDELLELAWVDGMAQSFAERLLRSRPDLKADVERVMTELSA